MVAGCVVADRDFDNLGDAGSVDQVDHAPTLPTDTHQPGELELGEVLANGSDRLSDLGRERADVSFSVAQQPDDMQAGGRSEHAEQGGTLVQLFRRDRCPRRRHVLGHIILQLPVAVTQPAYLRK